MILLALDQSSKCSGYAVFNNDTLITYGKFTFEDTDIGIRLMKIRNKMKELVDQYHPDEVAFEDIQQQDNIKNNVQTFKILAQVQGVVYELLTELKIPHKCILAATWKSTLGIKGKTRPEQKRNAQQFIIDKYKIKPTQDEVDSICIGEHYIKNERCAWAN